VTWSLASLGSGAATNLTVTVMAPVVGSLTNLVASSSVTGDPNLSNNNGSGVTARVVTGVYPLLSLTGKSLQANGFQVEFYLSPNTRYSLQASTNLVNWITEINTNSGDGHVIYLDSNTPGFPQRFYRSLLGP
jgi:hypothetical protein